LRNLSIYLIVTIVLSALVVSLAVGSGYQLNEQGARAVGMGGAFVARASDPSAIYFNPAGLAFQKGINVLGGVNFIMPTTKFTGALTQKPVETTTKSQVFTPVNFYGTYQINDDIVVGLGVFNPFGLGTEWPDLWGQALNNVYVGSQLLGGSKSDLQMWYFNPSVGYKVNDQLSFGLGVSYVYGSAKISQKVGNPLTGAILGNSSLDGTGSGFNVNVGGIYKPLEGLSLGFSYRMQTDVEFSGDFKVLTSTMTGKATLPMPGSFYFGIAYDLMPELTVETDLQYIQWSAYNKLEVKLPTGTTTQNKGWNDNVTLRGGAEYKLDNEVTLRGGVLLDLTPQPKSKTEPMLPDADRLDISLGGSYKIDENLSVDLSYMIVLFMERDAKTSSLPGIYKSTAHIISVDLGYSF
jgi:long-chain fatty acid transport protein